MSSKLCLSLFMLVILCSCRQSANQNQATANQARTEPSQTAKPTPQTGEKVLKITSEAFQEGGMIPKDYTCDGANISPPLQWENVPERAKTLALIADDPDAPAKTWVHWVAFNLPARARRLPEKVAPQPSIAGGGSQGTNDFRKVGYGGPCPPNGTHRYFFKLYALDTELTLDSKTTKDQLLKAMEGHIVAEAQLIGKYSR